MRLVFKDFPLPSHSLAPAAHAAARCAAAAGQFWAYHDRLFAEQSAFAHADLLRYAADLGLDASAFTTCLDGTEARSAVDADIATGRALGVRGTPTFLINGVLVIGAVPIEQFRDAIDEALRRAASSPKP